MDSSSLIALMMVRLGERILVVFIGGLAIYLGYRLFALVPTDNQSGGKITLPGFSVVLSKVAPGVFFAAFGSILLYQSLSKELDIKAPDLHISGAVDDWRPDQQTTALPAFPDTPTTNVDQRVDRARRSLQTLNCAERVLALRNLGLLAEDLEEPFRDAKIALLASIWDDQNWGDLNAFRHWAQTFEGSVPESLSQLYLEILPGCPE